MIQKGLRKASGVLDNALSLNLGDGNIDKYHVKKVNLTVNLWFLPLPMYECYSQLKFYFKNFCSQKKKNMLSFSGQINYIVCQMVVRAMKKKIKQG